MRGKAAAVLGGAVLFCLLALISVVAGDSQIIEINGDPVDISRSGAEIAFRDFSTDAAEVIITHIDSSGFPVIKVYVDVLDSFGVLLCGLTEEDFCVFEDGETVDFELASLDTIPCPTSVCLVMDVSGSMSEVPLQRAKEAATSFVRNMGPDGRAAIVTYSDCVETLQTFTGDTSLLIDAIASLTAEGLTAMFDGYWLGVDLTCSEPEVRAVIGFTDGQENHSQFCWPPPNGAPDGDDWQDDCDTVSSYAQFCRLPIYAIGVGPYAWGQTLLCLAQKTGGNYYYAPSADQLDSIYREIQGELCCRYLITYTSPDTVQDCDVHQVIVCEGGVLCTPCDTGYYHELCPPVLKRTPPTIALSDTCQPAGEDLVIEAWAVDTVPPPVQEVLLFWRITGSGPDYDQVTMTSVSDSLYRGIIPGSALPLGTPGVDYYLTASDGEATVSDPPKDPETSPYLIEICARQPPELTCPDNDSVHARRVFTSTDYSVTDPDDPTGVVVTLQSVVPTPTNAPALEDSHVVWSTTCADLDIGPDFEITLVATDPGGKADTCSFTVIVYNQPPVLTCPQDDSAGAGEVFVSKDYVVIDVADPSAPTVTLDAVSPDPTFPPSLVGTHIEWETTCGDVAAGPDFTFTLVAVDGCGAADTCDFTVTVYCSVIPEITCPTADSAHGGELFVSDDFSVSYPKEEPFTVALCGIEPAPVNQPEIVESHVEWQTDCADDGKLYMICLEAADSCGSKDTCYFDVRVYNWAPEMVCPDDGVINAGQTFVSSDFSFTDPDGDPVTVSFLDIDPGATNDPAIVDNHVEWVTSKDDEYPQDYVLRLIGVDACELAETCQFTVTLDEPAAVFECPDDGSVHAGNLFVSTSFTLTYPDCDPYSVHVLDVNRPVTNMPTVVGYQVEWLTTCDEDEDYIIRLMTGPECPTPDTCEFTVSVYNHPPELTCPDYGYIPPEGLFVSTDFFVSDPDGDQAAVSLLGIDPPADHDPVIVANHVEWETECVLGDYIITLAATDPCGLADTCEFMVTVDWDPAPDFYIWVYPTTQYVAAGHSVGYLVELNSNNTGFARPCSLYVSGLPDPPNMGVFDQVVMTPTDFTTLTVYTTAATDTGTYTLTVTGKEIAGPRAHTKQVYLNVGEPLDVDDEASHPNIPESFTLFQNQPNPFNPQTEISYFLPEDCQLSLTIYNVLGQKVKTLFEGYQNRGTHTLMWDGRDHGGTQMGSGIYFYRLRTREFDQTKKMVLMK